MNRKAVTNVTLILPDRQEENRTVVIEGGKIVEILSALPADDSLETVDGAGGYLAPGFIDLHFHGVHEYSMENGPESLAAIYRILPQYGVTGVLPTLAPRPKGQDAEYLHTLAQVKSDGAAVLGFHLEGPFLTHTGALPDEALGTCDPERVQALREACDPSPAIFSIAPDFVGIGELLPIMTAGGRPAFITHTSANVEQSRAAIEAGARHATHFYNVFYSPDVREPGVRPCGVVEAIYADPRCSVDFILDGVHVDPIAVEMALQCKGPDRVCLITDANIGAGLPPARYHFCGEEVEIHYPGGPARLTENSRSPGGLAGSGLTLDLAVRNALEMLPVDLPLAIRMASANPAQVLGLQGRKGQIAVGFDADLILLDKELAVQQTYVAGRCVYTKKT